MQLSDIKQLAYTARIDMSDEEAEGLSKDLLATLAYIDQVMAAPLPDEELVVPDHRNAVREDVVTNPTGSCADIVMAEAPFIMDGFVKVKKIL